MSDDKLNKIEEKIDKINEKLNEIHITLAENTQSLIVHEKRTDLAEKKLEVLENELKDKVEIDAISIKEIHRKIEPIHDHVIVVHAVVKYVIPAILTVLAFVYKFHIFKF